MTTRSSFSGWRIVSEMHESQKRYADVTKSDHMNSDLAKSNAYSKLDQKNVTAWLDLRNKAAHGQYNEYNADQVVLLISAIREFVTRNPA
jgi:hypothetical protein